MVVVFPDHNHLLFLSGYFCNHLAKGGRAGCLTVIESLLFSGVYSTFYLVVS